MKGSLRTLGVVAAGLIVAAAAPSARAVVGINAIDNAITGSGGNAEISTRFTVNNPSGITITGLGIWDAGADGLGSSHPVRLFTSTGTLLGSVTVPAGTTAPLSGAANNAGFRFVSLTTPVFLAANSTDVVEGYLFNNGASPDAYGDTNSGHPHSVTSTSDVTLTNNDYGLDGSTTSFNNNDQAQFGLDGYFFGASSFQYVVGTVPEPASLGLVGVGAAALLARRRRA